MTVPGQHPIQWRQVTVLFRLKSVEGLLLQLYGHPGGPFPRAVPGCHVLRHPSTVQCVHLDVLVCLGSDEATLSQVISNVSTQELVCRLTYLNLIRLCVANYFLHDF